MPLTVSDLELLQSEHSDWRMELVDGEIIVMSPSELESDEVALEIGRQLGNWVRPRKLGRVTGSSGGFVLPNAGRDVRAPDAAFIRAEKLKKSVNEYAQVLPDLIFEVRSKSDALQKLRDKIQVFLELGTLVGVLVDARTRTMEVYRLGQERIVLGDGDTLTVPEVLPGWELIVAEVWAPEFE
jgi:Uma2 family endonuclease